MSLIVVVVEGGRKKDVSGLFVEVKVRRFVYSDDDSSLSVGYCSLIAGVRCFVDALIESCSYVEFVVFVVVVEYDDESVALVVMDGTHCVIGVYVVVEDVTVHNADGNQRNGGHS